MLCSATADISVCASRMCLMCTGESPKRKNTCYMLVCVLYEMKWFQIHALSKTHGLLGLLAFFNILLHLYCRLEFLLEEMVGALETVAAAGT